MKCKLFFIGSLVLLTSCNTKPDFSGLCGEWLIIDETAKQVEIWNCDNTGARGNGFRIVGNDTLFAEKFSLAQFEDIWILNISVDGQNQDAYIPFELTKWANGMLEFNNPNHDFPNRIVYTWNSKDSLKAVVDDGPNGVKQLTFTFARASEVH